MPCYLTMRPWQSQIARVIAERTPSAILFLANPNVGLLFLVPGKQETLRVTGTALIVRDQSVREPMGMAGKLPELAPA